MENKNVLMAVVLSTLVIIFWQTFYGEPEFQKEQATKTQNEKVVSGKPSAPQINVTQAKIKITRDDALKETSRIQIENDNLVGSIALKGALIDDITLKKYNQKQFVSDKKVVLLNPKNDENSYYLETGWATAGKDIVPDNQSVWKIKGNNKLTPQSPITLEWDNQKGLTFIKKNYNR
jgi:YidC/Oxa1 family membrane protein insertase